MEKPFQEVVTGVEPISDSIYGPRYPRIPFTTAPAIILHRGEVTADQVQTFDKANLFLYSALARPGNSGGPVISSSGYVVGIATRQLDEKTLKDEQPWLEQPFYAGVGSTEIRRAL